MLSKLVAFHEVADHFARLSTCKRDRVGCVIAPPDLSGILALGYNGPTAGSPNDSCSAIEGACGCVHAEANALVKLATAERGLILFTTRAPCLTCAGLIINSGRIAIVIAGAEYRDPAGARKLESSGIVLTEGAAICDALSS